MGYKVYVERRLTGYTALPRIGQSDPGFVSAFEKRHGFSTAKDAVFNKYVHPSEYDAIHYRTKRPGRVYYGEWYGFAFDVDSAIQLDYIKIYHAGQRVRNRAYEEFKESAVGETSSLGITFAQWRQSLGMVANRAWQLGSATRHLLRGRPNSFLTALGLAPQPKYARRNRDYVRKAAGIFLEGSFGWKPLVQDIHAAFQQCEETPPALKKARGSSIQFVDGQLTPSAPHRIGGGFTVTQRGTVNCTNPNLFLASQLGLVNPASVLFDAIPFSFVVDWFIDCQVWIDSFTDFLGVSITDPAITETFRGVASLDFAWPSVYVPQESQQVVIQRLMRRRPGLIRPYPNAQILGNMGKSLVRAGNALSLLAQILLQVQRVSNR